ncbi:MAG: amidophosphoribosyltransferase [Candidatus Sumerlaeota bacterium]|nr:amidophosphoribosyltransferase [Candidatus Sumerlaeota bacterium]
MSDEHFHDNCGIFGVFGNPEASNLVYLGLYGLQHRGQETAGIVSSDGQRHYQFHGMGRVANVFHRSNLDRLKGHVAVGHVRYSTTGSSAMANAQPIAVICQRGPLALAHNGNLTNAAELREALEARGAIFQTFMDTEILLHQVAQSTSLDMRDALITSLFKLQGSYSFLLMTRDALIAMRDPHGLRPLALGKKDGSWLVASESCAFDVLDGEFVRDVEPGEIVTITKDGLHSEKPFAALGRHFCIFEYIYFLRPDSFVDGMHVYEIRKELGRQLARECPTQADVVVAVPDSSNVAALGYAQESGIPYELGLIRSHYIGRTFIEPDRKIRHFGAKIKYNAVRSALTGKRVVIVDDSIVRGTTSGKIVRMLQRAGAKEVHFRVSSPPIIGSCFYGIDTPTTEELIASNNSVEEIRQNIGADSLYYLSIQGLLKATGRNDGFCLACFTGDYFAGRPNNFSKEILEKGSKACGGKLKA